MEETITVEVVENAEKWGPGYKKILIDVEADGEQTFQLEMSIKTAHALARGMLDLIAAEDGLFDLIAAGD